MCVCVCVHAFTDIVWNELICGHASGVNTSSLFNTHTHTHTHTHTRSHTHILIPFENHKPMGLKVNIAEVSFLNASIFKFFF